MKDLMQPMSRRSFFKCAAIGAGTLVAVSILPKAMAAGGTSLKSTIGDNHGHRFTATLEELMAAGPKTYDIQGSSRHPHELEITQEILDTLNKTKVVDVDSSEVGSHTHVVRLEII